MNIILSQNTITANTSFVKLKNLKPQKREERKSGLL
jgi:hypothetical protein